METQNGFKLNRMVCRERGIKVSAQVAHTKQLTPKKDLTTTMGNFDQGMSAQGLFLKAILTGYKQTNIMAVRIIAKSPTVTPLCEANLKVEPTQVAPIANTVMQMIASSLLSFFSGG